jgi:hypothetical protein
MPRKLQQSEDEEISVISIDICALGKVAVNIESVGFRNERNYGMADGIGSARRTEDIALDLLKFVASQANVGSKSTASTTGFGLPTAAKSEDQVTHLLELYSKCRQAVEAPGTK